MSKKVFEISKGGKMTADQITTQLQNYIADIGRPWLGGGRKQLFWRVSLVTGITTSRIATLFYNKGANPSALEYVIIRAKWEQLARDAETVRIAAAIRKTDHEIQDRRQVRLRRAHADDVPQGGESVQRMGDLLDDQGAGLGA